MKKTHKRITNIIVILSIASTAYLSSKIESLPPIIVYSVQDQCTVPQSHCFSCYTTKFQGKEYCEKCEDEYILDINQAPYQCISCPDECLNDCNPSTGCESCLSGYYIVQTVSENIYKTRVNICQQCSTECKECVDKKDNCTACPEYFKVDNKKCVFAYMEYVYLGIFLIFLVIITMVCLIIKCICMESAPEKPTFATILDKDDDLQTDHMKYDMKTIGTGNRDDSFISVVEALGEDNDYLNVSEYSQDPILSQLLGPGNSYNQIHSDAGEMLGGTEPENFSYQGQNQRNKRNHTVYKAQENISTTSKK